MPIIRNTYTLRVFAWLLALVRYSQVALRRAVWELHRLEVAPVDGTTLCEFLHSRGINMRYLGRIVQLSREAVSKEAADIIRQEAAA
eukprot:scaffold536139_cov36-Prasinocladus_malaysianus.AAC.1